LIDEIFSGTNSGDRLAGAEALIEDLLRHGAIGMVTTHDLALTRIAENLRDRGANAHFIDRIEDGRMVFDYQLRAGIVCGSNARGLMRAIGIGVSENR
jgi:DNA mismatch repair ATPase MutS